MGGIAGDEWADRQIELVEGQKWTGLWNLGLT